MDMQTLEESLPLDNVAAVFLLRGDGALLMQHRDDKPGLRHADMWVPPGGHCDPGEAPIACARREFLEETCYDCEMPRFLTAITDHPGHGWKPLRLHVFWSVYDGIQSWECREGQELRFVARSEAHRYAIPENILPLWDQALKEAKRHA